MIRVHRTRVRKPAILADDSPAAVRERQRAKDHFTKAKTEKKTEAKDGSKESEQARSPFTFKIYKDESVKAALEELFHGKCAYCESYYGGVQPVDVEHWRPKAEVTPEEWEGTDPLSGYWFLASQWENLLPSCIDCNRARTQKDVGRGDTRIVGKANRFPVDKDSKRAAAQEAVGAERPMLLHPCDDNPNDHLRCDPRDPSILIARDGSAKGEQSIDVYGLNRSGLVVARRDRLTEVRLHLYLLKVLLDIRQRTASAAQAAWLDDLRDHELRVIHAFRREHEPFAMMSRAVIDEFMAQLCLGVDSPPARGSAP